MVYVFSRMGFKSHYSLVFDYPENHIRNNYLKFTRKKKKKKKKSRVERKFQLTVLLTGDVLQFKVSGSRNIL